MSGWSVGQLGQRPRIDRWGWRPGGSCGLDEVISGVAGWGRAETGGEYRRGGQQWGVWREAELAGRSRRTRMLGFCRKARGPRLARPGSGTRPVLQAGVCVSALGELASASLS